MAVELPGVVLDTNILVSAIIWDGKPRQILKLALSKEIRVVISPFIMAELIDVLVKKFGFAPTKITVVEKKIKNIAAMVYPAKSIKILKDAPDNRVLEAAIAGNCGFVITGDKELLKLGGFQNIKIVSANNFLEIFSAGQ